HQSAQVRASAARALLENDPGCLGLLAFLAADPAATQVLRPFLAAKREPAVENYLLNYLQASHKESRDSQNPGILECYRTLGLCASAESLPFLSQVLLKKSWKTFMSRSPDLHRVGAALALSLMPRTGQAEEILQKAARSAFKNVRLAYEEDVKLRPRPAES
ncbi:MAG: hypothetical protein LBK52_03275, partial [Deltaproteobacteria bacterium]|nr:hypothetical protein [Deltaproteobacteria bacterium]